MSLTEAEIQVLASLEKARLDGTPTDRKSLEDSAERFWIFAEDWGQAYATLLSRGLTEGDDTAYGLSEIGAPLAQEFHRQRPDHYWYYYQKFYQAAHASEAHSELCRRVFGEDLCQEGQTDMATLKDLMEKLALSADDQVLDLGCGVGVIAEYVSDVTGAFVTGIDYSYPAIDEANEKAADKRERLFFVQGDMNNLELEENSLDAMISLDTLYWAADLEATLSSVAKALKPGGRMGIFMNHHIGEGEDKAHLAPQHAEPYKALTNLGLAFEITDCSTEICAFWHRVNDAATDLQPQFEAEGNGFIAASLLRECELDYLPDVKAGRIARYLYVVQC